MLLGVLSIISLLLIGWYFVSHKLMADREERVITAWARLDRAYQQRENLVRELLNTNEEKTQLVNNTRSAWQDAVALALNPEEFSSMQVRTYSERKKQLEKSLDLLIDSLSDITDQKTTKVTAEHQQAGQEIAEAIDRYNAAVRDYNTLNQHFPVSLLNFSEKPFYPVSEQK